MQNSNTDAEKTHSHSLPQEENVVSTDMKTENAPSMEKQTPLGSPTETSGSDSLAPCADCAELGSIPPKEDVVEPQENSTILSVPKEMREADTDKPSRDVDAKKSIADSCETANAEVASKKLETDPSTEKFTPSDSPTETSTSTAPVPCANTPELGSTPPMGVREAQPDNNRTPQQSAPDPTQQPKPTSGCPNPPNPPPVGSSRQAVVQQQAMEHRTMSVPPPLPQEKPASSPSSIHQQPHGKPTSYPSPTPKVATAIPQQPPTDTVPVPEEPPRPKAATWKNLPPSEPWCPENLSGKLGFSVDYKDDYAIRNPTFENWEILAATKRGKMHAHHGTHREDAFAWKGEPNFAIYCVCDGAGSAKLSRIGSEYTARQICLRLAGHLLTHETEIQTCSKDSLPKNLKQFFPLVVQSVQESLKALANSEGELAPKDFRCTVLTALHYKHPTGNLFLFGSVGDGFIAIKQKNKQAERISTSDSGGFSGEVLCFMPDTAVTDFYQRSMEMMTPLPDSEVEAIFLCTDGIEDPFFPVQKTIPALYEQLETGYVEPINEVKYQPEAKPLAVFPSENPADELAKWLNFEKRGENDDRTILIARSIKK